MPLTDQTNVETIEEGGGCVTEGDIDLLFEDCDRSFKKLQSDAARIVFDFYKLRSKLDLLLEARYGRLSESSSKVQTLGRSKDSFGERPRLAESKQKGLFDRPSRPTPPQAKAEAPKAKKEKK